MSEFGDSFRTARESKKLTIEQIAQETRISARFLKAIEEEDFQSLPGGLFNRGFVRAYAGRLGLDPDDAVRRYVALVPAAPVEATDSAVVEPVPSDGIERHIIPIAIGALVVLIVILFFVFGGGGSESTPDTVPGAVDGAVEPPLQPVEALVEAPVEDALPSAETLPPDVAAETAVEAEATSPPSPPVDATPDSPPLATPNLVVEVDARNATWIRIRSDESPAEEMTMQPGSTRTFSAERMINVQIGNVSGVNLSINGQPVPAHGEDGQVLSLDITPENYRSLLAPE